MYQIIEHTGGYQDIVAETPFENTAAIICRAMKRMYDEWADKNEPCLKHEKKWTWKKRPEKK